MLAGKHHGKIKAMHDERGHVRKKLTINSSISVRLDGAATAGDKFNVFDEEKQNYRPNELS